MGFICWDDFDCACDVRLARRRLKRRRVSIKGFAVDTYSHSLKKYLDGLGDAMVDGDYRTFLNELGKYSEQSRSGIDEEDDVDPDYKLFLERVRENGESYALEVSELRAGGSGREDGNDSDEDGDADPHYKIFLEKVREDGKSYVFEVSIDKLLLCIKYEGEDDSDETYEPSAMRKSRKVSIVKKMGAVKDLRNLASKGTMESRKNQRNVARKDKTDSNVRDVIAREGRNIVLEKDLKSKNVKHVLGKRDGCSSKKPRLTEVDESDQIYPMCLPEEGDCMDGKKPSPKDSWLVEVDESCQISLKRLQEEGDCMDGKRVNDEVLLIESFPDVEILEITNFDGGTYNPFETSKQFDSFTEEDEWQCLGSPSRSRSDFRENLMGRLRESFDHSEYEKLWKDISERRPKKCRHIDLRGAGSSKSIATKELSPSYLEVHSVLRRKIDKVQFDRCKVLNLLRGFFYWLQNLAHEDAFCPWLDPSCLEVMPRNH